jgi:hypothetical protein
MYTLVLLAVLLTVLSEPVAASSLVMDFSMAGAPLDSIFPETEDMFNPLCELCCIPLFQCMHTMVGNSLLLKLPRLRIIATIPIRPGKHVLQ